MRKPLSLLEEIRIRGLDNYGSEITGNWVRSVLGLVMPTLATKKEFDSIALIEMSAVDAVRFALLGEGKYLAATGGNYRVLLPSETACKIDAYIEQASRKLRRAKRLSQSLPKTAASVPSNTSARLMLMEQSVPRPRAEHREPGRWRDFVSGQPQEHQA